MQLVEGDILLYQFECCSHSFLFGLERLSLFPGRDSALMVDSRVILRQVVTMMLLPLFVLSNSVDAVPSRLEKLVVNPSKHRILNNTPFNTLPSHVHLL